MISTKDLSGLPNAERLKNFCKGLAALDIIMVEEEWLSLIHIYLGCHTQGKRENSRCGADRLPDPQPG